MKCATLEIRNANLIFHSLPIFFLERQGNSKIGDVHEMIIPLSEVLSVCRNDSVYTSLPQHTLHSNLCHLIYNEQILCHN